MTILNIKIDKIGYLTTEHDINTNLSSMPKSHS